MGRLLTRTQVTGLENLPTHPARPYIFAANHASTYDPILMLQTIPYPYRSVGPGDFKLLFPGNLIVENLGVIRIQRGAADRDSLKQMTEVLKRGEHLSLFPDGGTWEKPIEEVKPGAAYLSATTGAQIVPVAVSGSYQVWGKMLKLQRPRLHVHFCAPLPPLDITDRKRRNEILDQASQDLMHLIYKHLTPEEQARYQTIARQRFDGRLVSLPHAERFAEARFPVLAELISKPNLFSPLHRNLKLPLRPLVHTDTFHPAHAFKTSAQALLTAFTETVKDYVSYRLGEAKARQILQELETLIHVAQEAHSEGLRLRFQPEINIHDPANEPT